MYGLLSAQYVYLYKALSHPIRLEILTVISECATSVNDLDLQLNKRQSNVSQHLQMLQKNHLVFSKQVGKPRIYTLNPKEMTLIVYLAKYKV